MREESVIMAGRIDPILPPEPSCVEDAVLCYEVVVMSEKVLNCSSEEKFVGEGVVGTGICSYERDTHSLVWSDAKSDTSSLVIGSLDVERYWFIWSISSASSEEVKRLLNCRVNVVRDFIAS
jgi:hypothetical protein